MKLIQSIYAAFALIFAFNTATSIESKPNLIRLNLYTVPSFDPQLVDRDLIPEQLRPIETIEDIKDSIDHWCKHVKFQYTSDFLNDLEVSGLLDELIEAFCCDQDIHRSILIAAHKAHKENRALTHNDIYLALSNLC